jgi:hypothetical protein
MEHKIRVARRHEGITVPPARRSAPHIFRQGVPQRRRDRAPRGPPRCSRRSRARRIIIVAEPPVLERLKRLAPVGTSSAPTGGRQAEEERERDLGRRGGVSRDWARALFRVVLVERRPLRRQRRAAPYHLDAAAAPRQRQAAGAAHVLDRCGAGGAPARAAGGMGRDAPGGLGGRAGFDAAPGVHVHAPLPAATATEDDAAGTDAEALHTQTDERRTSRLKNRTSSAGRMARRHQKATSKDQADASSGGKKHTSPAVGAKPAPNLAAYMASPQRASRSAGPRDLAENSSFAVPDGLPRPSIPPLRLSAITPLAATPVAFGGMSAMTTPTSSAASTPRMFEPLVPAPSMTATRRQRQDSDSSIISTSIDTRPSQRNKTEAPAAREAGKAPRQGSWVDEDPESFAYIYDEPWARSLGVKAPPRRSHRREGLNAAAAASDSRGDVAAKSADAPRPTAGFGIFSGLGARGHAAPTAAPTRSLSGLDFSQLERPLPPIDTLKRSPSPPKPAPQQPLPAVPAPQPSRRSAATPAIPVAAARGAPPQIPTPHAAVPPIRVVPARASTFNLPTTTQLPSQGVSPFTAGGAPPASSTATKPTMPSARLSPIVPSLKPPGGEAAPVAPPPANVEPAVASVPTPSETAKPNERSIPPPSVQQPQAAAPAAWGGSGGAAPGLSTGVRQAQQSAAPPTTGAWGAKSTSAIGAGAFGGSAASALGGAAVTATPAATFGGRPPLAPAPPPPSKVRYDDEVLPPEAYAAAMSHMPPAMKSMLFANVAPSRPTLGGSAAVASLTAPAPPQRGGASAAFGQPPPQQPQPAAGFTTAAPAHGGFARPAAVAPKLAPQPSGPKSAGAFGMGPTASANPPLTANAFGQRAAPLPQQPAGPAGGFAPAATAAPAHGGFVTPAAQAPTLMPDPNVSASSAGPSTMFGAKAAASPWGAAPQRSASPTGGFGRRGGGDGGGGFGGPTGGGRGGRGGGGFGAPNLNNQGGRGGGGGRGSSPRSSSRGGRQRSY